jgi:hypothetical protein
MPSSSLGKFKSPSTLSQESGSNIDGSTSIENLENIISTVIGVITVVGSIFFIINFIIAAFNWITSDGDQGKLKSARDRMTQSVIGLVIVVASYSLIALLGSIVGIELLNFSGQIHDITSGITPR